MSMMQAFRGRARQDCILQVAKLPAGSLVQDQEARRLLHHQCMAATDRIGRYRQKLPLSSKGTMMTLGCAAIAPLSMPAVATRSQHTACIIVPRWWRISKKNTWRAPLRAAGLTKPRGRTCLNSSKTPSRSGPYLLTPWTMFADA
jgi:hypothetical protein